MAINQRNKCRLCRRAGEKLFLKGDRCATPKCAMIKRPYPPGIHGAKGSSRGRGLTEYGKQLQQKQKVKRIYGVTEKQFRKHLNEAIKQKGIAGDNLVTKLESRLDNVIFRMNLASSRAAARNLVSHGHFQVNGKNLNIPSAYVELGDKITVKKNKLEKNYFVNKQTVLKKNLEIPGWVAFDPKKMSGEIVSMPNKDDVNISVDIQEVVEFYSR
ncbi:MAG: 30S ribosomal protein S4 [Candidatus Moranbacteria bacterium]|nr:30S ribosomal protein S4 [Candidatus Moranbacteria bacterium]